MPTYAGYPYPVMGAPTAQAAGGSSSPWSYTPAPSPYGPKPATATGAPGSLSPGGVSYYDPVYGGIPSVPNPTGTAGQTIGGNIGNLAGLYGLSGGVGGASATGATSQLNTALPGATASMGTALGNTNSLLAGQIPPDVLRLLQQQSAERGVATGQGVGSPNTNANYLQGLGLTSLGLEQTGLSNLGSLVGMAPTGPAFNPASMLTTPQDQQMYQYLANELGAAPIPAAAGNANLNALRNAIGAGRNATGPGAVPTAPQTGQQGSGALGFGFGTMGPLGTGSTVASGSGNPDDPTQWMNQGDLATWNQMTQEQQYMEQLMGFPSFYQWPTDTQSNISAPQSQYDIPQPAYGSALDASQQSNWDMTDPYAF